MPAPLLAQIGIPVLVRLLSEALGSIDNPLAKGAARALGEVDAAIRTGGIDSAQIESARLHAEKMAQIEHEEFRASLSEVNQSLRAEVASEDPYVRRMRPTFGYLMAFTWAAQMLGLAYVIVFQTSKASVVLDAMGSLSAIWAVALSVLGIYVYKRSEEKRLIRRLESGETIAWDGPRKDA